MSGFADEEPEVHDSDDAFDWQVREDEHANGHCRRCGHEGHADRDCPTVTPLLLKP